MSEFPLDPYLSRILLASSPFACSAECLSIVAMLSVPMVFLRPKDCQSEADAQKQKFAHEDGDHLTLLNVFNAFVTKKMNAEWCYEHFVNFRAMKSANDIREQLMSIMVKLGIRMSSTPSSDPTYYTKIRKSILSGYFMQTAHLEKAGHYMTLKDN